MIAFLVEVSSDTVHNVLIMPTSTKFALHMVQCGGNQELVTEIGTSCVSLSQRTWGNASPNLSKQVDTQKFSK